YIDICIGILFTIDIHLDYIRSGLSDRRILEFQNLNRDVYDQLVYQTSTFYNIDIAKESNYKYWPPFEYCEKTKTYLLNRLITTTSLDIEVPDTVLNMEKRIQNKLQLYEREIYSYSETKDTSFLGFYLEIEKARIDFIEYLAGNYTDYYKLKYFKENVSIPEIKNTLANQKQSALIEYYIAPWYLYISVITHNSFYDTIIDANPAFNQSISDYSNLIFSKSSMNDFAKKSHSLYNILLGDFVIPKLKENNINNLIIIPDIDLINFPFYALVSDTTNNEIRYFLEDGINLSYHYSATLWHQQVSNPNDNKPDSFVAFAPYEKDSVRGSECGKYSGCYDYCLKGSSDVGTEVIEKYFKENENSNFVKERATEKNFRENIKNKGIIHIATHGCKNNNKPFLAFSTIDDTTSANNGHLYYGEVYGLEDVKADLVMMAACETGLGETIVGEGVMSLVRGFLYAGANNVIYTTWSVPNDANITLTGEFYRLVFEDKLPYAEALRLAKLKVYETPIFSKIENWAGYQLIGVN
ncbi:MAG: CHAT domain-containing protein, partial [Desulfobacteraceae bacterium]|nr:CHAT domain-containing protein [Desulfobacteraceae bacterium]